MTKFFALACAIVAASTLAISSVTAGAPKMAAYSFEEIAKRDDFGQFLHKKGVFDKRATTPSKLGAVITSCKTAGTVAVTFDDGPGYQTATLLKYLKTQNLKVTFFINGNNTGLITQEPLRSNVIQAYKDGHQIASHTWSHADLTDPKVDMVGEMKKLDDTLLTLIGKRPVYMRPPYGAINDKVNAYLTAQGYKIVTWNIDTNDWQHPTDYNTSLQAYKDVLIHSANKKLGWIGLEHDSHPETALHLAPKIVSYVLGKGYKIVPVGTCMGDTKNWYRA